MVEGGDSVSPPRGSWAGRGAARASGRSLSLPGGGFPQARPRAVGAWGVALQGAWASGQERRGGPPSAVLAQQGISPPPCGGWGVPVAESVLAPPGPIPNPVVTQRSAGEYCGGDPTGGEAAADTPHPLPAAAVRRPAARPRSGRRIPNPSRGGAAAARWAHNPKVGGSNPSPATTQHTAEASVPIEGVGAFCISRRSFATAIKMIERRRGVNITSGRRFVFVHQLIYWIRIERISAGMRNTPPTI